MSLIKEDQQKQLKEIFSKLENNVKLVFFTQEMECQYCAQTRQLLNDVADLSNGKIIVEVYDFVSDKNIVEKYNIDKIPATVVEGQKDYGIRFYGIPAGYEFTSLIGTIMAVSSGNSNLSEETKSALKKLKEPVHIQTFVTVTCPYCPKAVELSHRLAMESDLISADMVESSEFPHLVQKYNVTSVPKVIINDKIELEGALPEKEYVEKLMKILEPEIKNE